MFPSLSSRQTGASHRRATRIGRNSRAKTPPARGEVDDMTATGAASMPQRTGTKPGPHTTQPESRRQLQRERAVLRGEISELKKQLADANFSKLQAESKIAQSEMAYAKRTGWDLLKTGVRRIFGK